VVVRQLHQSFPPSHMLDLSFPARRWLSLTIAGSWSLWLAGFKTLTSCNPSRQGIAAHPITVAAPLQSIHVSGWSGSPSQLANCWIIFWNHLQSYFDQFLLPTCGNGNVDSSASFFKDGKPSALISLPLLQFESIHLRLFNKRSPSHYANMWKYTCRHTCSLTLDEVFKSGFPLVLQGIKKGWKPVDPVDEPMPKKKKKSSFFHSFIFSNHYFFHRLSNIQVVESRWLDPFETKRYIFVTYGRG